MSNDIAAKMSERAGWEAGYHGPRPYNCDFTYFTTPELTEAWEVGNKRGKADLALRGGQHKCSDHEDLDNAQTI